MDDTESLRLISPGGVGRIAYTGRFGPTVLPVNYRLYEGTIVFRTAQDSPTDEDLRTGIAHAEYKVAFEIDDFSLDQREGWSVLIQGGAHHVDSDVERAAVLQAGVEAWPEGEREHSSASRRPDHRPPDPPEVAAAPGGSVPARPPSATSAGFATSASAGPGPGAGRPDQAGAGE